MKKIFGIGIFAGLALLVAIVFVSYRNKSDSDSDTFSEKDFAAPIDLKGSVLQVDAMIMRPRNIHTVGNLLFLTNVKTEYIFEVYDLNTGKKINECIKFGQGPDEMIIPTIVNLTKDSLWIYDIQTRLLRSYRMKDFISNLKPESVNKIKLSHSHHRAIVLSNNKIVAYNSQSIDKKFDYYDLDAKLLDSKGEYTDESLSAMENMMTYRLDYTTSLNDRVFACYTFGDIIEIYDGSTGDLIKRRYGPNKFKPVLKSVSKDGATTASVGVRDLTHLCYHLVPVRAGNEVFVLYFGDLYEKYKSTCNKILVFDFEGNPLRIYNLDIPLGVFTVDAEKRIIYGLTDEPVDRPNAQSDFNIIKYEY
jgi:WD40 repeat protein